MPFSESLKLKIRKQSDNKCCICQSFGVDVHHIIPQEVGGADNEENAVPLCARCHDTYGHNPYKRKQIREAKKSWFEKCRSKNTLASMNLTELAHTYVTREEFNTLRNELSELKKDIKIRPTLFSKLKLSSRPTALLQAKYLISKKKYSEAKRILLEETANKQYADEIWYLLGYLYGEEGDVPEMIDTFDKSLAISSKFVSPIKDYKKYTWQTTFNKGVGFFNAAVKDSNPESMKNNFKKAIDFFNKASLCEPSEIASYENIVSAYLNMDDHEGAIPTLKKLTDIGKPAYSFAQLGQIYVINGSKLMESFKISQDVIEQEKAFDCYRNALTILKNGVEKYPSDSGILIQLGNAFYLSGKIGKAISSFKMLVNKMPDDENIRYAYGVVLLKGKRYKKSVEELSFAISLDEKNIDAVYNLAAAYINWGNSLREKAILKKSSSKLYLEKFKAAVPYLEKYLALKPEEAKVWASLYQVYANLGMKKEAEEAYTKANR